MCMFLLIFHHPFCFYLSNVQCRGRGYKLGLVILRSTSPVEWNFLRYFVLYIPHSSKLFYFLFHIPFELYKTIYNILWPQNYCWNVLTRHQSQTIDTLIDSCLFFLKPSSLKCNNILYNVYYKQVVWLIINKNFSNKIRKFWEQKNT